MMEQKIHIALQFNLATGKVGQNPPPKIEFYRYCKGLHVDFMHIFGEEKKAITP